MSRSLLPIGIAGLILVAGWFMVARASQALASVAASWP
jgi:hypothetical protein